MSATAEITPASMAAMNRAIANVQQYLHKSGPESIKFAADMFTRSAAARCKPGQKRRKVTALPGRNSAWLIETYTQQQGRTHVFSTDGTKDKRVKIARRGLLRASWWWLQKQIRGVPAKSNITGVPVDTAVETERALAGDNPFIELTNKLKYVAAAAPGVVTVAMATAARGIQHRIDRVVSKQAERLWK